MSTEYFTSLPLPHWLFNTPITDASFQLTYYDYYRILFKQDKIEGNSGRKGTLHAGILPVLTLTEKETSYSFFTAVTKYLTRINLKKNTFHSGIEMLGPGTGTVRWCGLFREGLALMEEVCHSDGEK